MTDTTEILSPDNNFKLHFYDAIEPRMMMTMSKFSLTDLRTKDKVMFKPLLTLGYKGHSTSWTDSSRFFSLAIGLPSDSFFIYDTHTKTFAAIHFNNVWVLDGHCFDDRIEIEFRDDQIPERKEHNKYPTKNFAKPTNLTFNFDTLTWTSIDKIGNYKSLPDNRVVYDLKPIDNGWREFKGDLPQTTKVLVWELNEFAKYGDRQSKEWWDEIQSKTADINYWVNASEYLGQRRRK